MQVSDGIIRVLCVDDCPIVLDGIMLILSRAPDLQVVAAASSGEEALALLARKRPDVTVVSLRLPIINGVGAIRAICRHDPGARIVVVTTDGRDHGMYEALEAGAAAYLSKNGASDDLVRVIREVHAGKRMSTPHNIPPGDTQKTLTRRERQVVELLAQAVPTKAVASSLGISVQTVHAHLKNVFVKLGVQDRIGAVMTARRRGMIDLY